MSVRRDSLPSNRIANREPLPGSRKVYVSGPGGMRVPFREITLHPTRGMRGETELNAPLRVYDTSGPYTDPDVAIDLRRGPSGAAAAVDPRARGVRRGATRSGASAPGLALTRPPRVLRGRGTSRRCTTPAGAIVTPEMEFVAMREGCGPSSSGARSRAAARSCPANINHPESEPMVDRTQLPRQDQRQHRQLRRRLLDRGGGREDDVGDALGRRHGHGPLDRQEHPRDAGVDPAQLPRADRHRPDLPGAREGRTGRPRS